MATENLKSTQITNLDANPVTQGGATAGEGGNGALICAEGYGVTATTAVTNGSTYQMCRVPTTAKIKQIWLCLDAAVTTFTGKIGLTYSTSDHDGTKQSNVAAVVSGSVAPTAVSGADTLFASSYAMAAITTMTEVSNQSGNYTTAKRVKRLWDAAGLSSDPSGFFDIRQCPILELCSMQCRTLE